MFQIDAPIATADYLAGLPFLSLQQSASAVPTASKAFLPPAKKFKDPVFGGSGGQGRGGKGTSAKPPVPRHDPTAEGALVMMRPDSMHSTRFNKKNLPVVDVVIDPLIGQHLRPHQQECVKLLPLLIRMYSMR